MTPTLALPPAGAVTLAGASVSPKSLNTTLGSWSMHLPSLFDHSSCTVKPAALPGCPTQMSPISPHCWLLSIQPEPPLGSVTASTSSCAATMVRRSNAAQRRRAGAVRRAGAAVLIGDDGEAHLLAALVVEEVVRAVVAAGGAAAVRRDLHRARQVHEVERVAVGRRDLAAVDELGDPRHEHARLVDGGAGRRRRVGVLGGEPAASDRVARHVVLGEPVEVGAVGDGVVVGVQLVLVLVLPVVRRAPVERHDRDVGDERAVAVLQVAGGAGGARLTGGGGERERGGDHGGDEGERLDGQAAGVGERVHARHPRNERANRVPSPNADFGGDHVTGAQHGAGGPPTRRARADEAAPSATGGAAAAAATSPTPRSSARTPPAPSTPRPQAATS